MRLKKKEVSAISLTWSESLNSGPQLELANGVKKLTLLQRLENLLHCEPA